MAAKYGRPDTEVQGPFPTFVESHARSTYSQLSRGWSPPLTAHGQADDSYGFTAIAVGLLPGRHHF
jgi:hypothetical protein